MIPIKSKNRMLKTHPVDDRLIRRKRRPIWIVAFCLSNLISLVTTTTLASEQGKAASIEITNPFARALPASSENGAVYLTLINNGDQPDRLVAAKTPISEQAELHTHRNEDGMMRMRKVESVQIEKKDGISLVPGGTHIMLINLLQHLIEGESFPLTLYFEKAGNVSISVPIMSSDAISAIEHDGHTHGNSDKTNPPIDNMNASVVRFELGISDGKSIKSNQTFRITQGEIVQVYITSDESHILHLHGYDIEIAVDPESVSVFQLEANTAGRFPIEIHGAKSHHALFYLEVYPK